MAGSLGDLEVVRRVAGVQSLEALVRYLSHLHTCSDSPPEQVRLSVPSEGIVQMREVGYRDEMSKNRCKRSLREDVCIIVLA